MIVAGGGVIYSEATDALRALRRGDRHPGRRDAWPARARCRSITRRRSARSASPARAGAEPARARGRPRDRRSASRLSDFTTASKTAFQHPDVRFVNINVTEFDAGKHEALPLVGDARATLEEWLPLLAGLADRRRRISERVARREGGVGARGRSRSHADRRAGASSQGAGDRRAQRGHARPTRRHRLRRRQPARRSAQAVARARSEAVSPRVRLLVHGLRDRRRPRRARWPRPIARSTCWSATART